MAFNIENLIINRVVRGTLFDKSTNEVIMSVDQIADASLECAGEQVFATDAIGQQIAAFDRSKSATFSASNALLNFGLMAAQFGSEKVNGTEDAKIVVPRFELLDVKGETVELAETPAEGSLKFIYTTHSDKSKDQKYALATAASETEFALAGKVITLPTEIEAGARIAVWYEAEMVEAQIIRNTTDKFAKGGKFVLEVLACDVCDTNKEYYAYVIFGNAKMDNNTTIEFNTEATQAFSLTALQDYCSANNELFSIVVAE